MSRRKLRVITLGCSKNKVDTEHLLSMLPSFTIVDDGNADVLLINTCGFIGDAKEESIQTILEAVEAKKRGEFGSIGVFGCLSHRYSGEMPGLIPEVDAWFGARELEPVAEWVAGLFGGKASYGRDCGQNSGRIPGRYLCEKGLGYAYLKISEGCDRRCSYCAIPLIRGPHKSVPMEDLVTETTFLASSGVKELIIIAQDSTYYGLDLYGRRALGKLLERLSRIEGIEWIRIHYSYPDNFPDDVIDAMATNPKILPYMDIPLQHISDKVLSNMHRHITGAQTRELVARMRERVPDLALRTTMIVGHPGEGPEEFAELLDFVRQTRFDRLGAFCYSEEEGTWGAQNLSDDVPPEEKQRRMDELMELQAQISLETNRARIGTVERVLVDAITPDGQLVCRSRYESPEVDGEILVDISSGQGPATENVSLTLDPTVRFAPVPPLTLPRVARFSHGSPCPEESNPSFAGSPSFQAGPSQQAGPLPLEPRAASLAGRNCPSPDESIIGQFITVRITDADTYDLFGEIIEEN